MCSLGRHHDPVDLHPFFVFLLCRILLQSSTQEKRNQGKDSRSFLQMQAIKHCSQTKVVKGLQITFVVPVQMPR